MVLLERESPRPSTLSLEESMDGQVLTNSSSSSVSAAPPAALGEEPAVGCQKEGECEFPGRLSALSRRVAVRARSWSIAWRGSDRRESIHVSVAGSWWIFNWRIPSHALLHCHEWRNTASRGAVEIEAPHPAICTHSSETSNMLCLVSLRNKRMCILVTCDLIADGLAFLRHGAPL